MNPHTDADFQLTAGALGRLDQLTQNPDEATMAQAGEFVARSEAHLARFEECTELLNGLRAPGVLNPADVRPFPESPAAAPEMPRTLAAATFRVTPRAQRAVWQPLMAALFVCACAGLSLLWYVTRPVLHAAAATPDETAFSDGSTLVLARHSQARAHWGFTAREVSLDTAGRLWLDVTTNRGQPCIVRSGAARIEVHGTQFSVRRGSDAHTRIALARGQLTVYGRDAARVVLEPGQFVDVSPQGDIGPVGPNDPPPVPFTEASLQEIATAYNNADRFMQFDVSAEVAQRRYGGVLNLSDPGWWVELLRQDPALDVEQRLGLVTIRAASARR